MNEPAEIGAALKKALAANAPYLLEVRTRGDVPDAAYGLLGHRGFPETRQRLNGPGDVMGVMDRRELLQLGASAMAATTWSRTTVAQDGAPPPAAPRPPADSHRRVFADAALASHAGGRRRGVSPDRQYDDRPDGASRARPRPAGEGEDRSADVGEVARATWRRRSRRSPLTSRMRRPPYVEDILGTMNALGLRHHWWRGMGSFDNTKPVTARRSTR